MSYKNIKKLFAVKKLKKTGNLLNLNKLLFPRQAHRSGTIEVLVFNPEWIFNYECLLAHEICQINFTDACCTHK